MIYDHVGAIRDPFKLDLPPELCRNQKKPLGPIIFSTGDSHTKGMIFLLHPGLEGITEVDTDPKGRFVSFKVTPSNDRVLPLQGIAPENSLLGRGGGHFFEGLQSYIQNKSERNENKTILGGLNCTMDKIDWDGQSKT